MRLAATARRAGEVTLVEATVENDGVDPRRIRIESELDGPVWPPRREGVPEAGWDTEEGILTLTVPPGDRVGVGFASPADPVDPPVSVLETERASPDGGIDPSPAGVVRALGDPSPPADAVPASSDSVTGGGPQDGDPTEESADPSKAGSDPPEDPVDPPDRSPAPDADPGDPAESDGPVGPDAGDGTDPPIGGYPAVTAWLAAVEGRIERAEAGDPDPEGVDGDADRLRDLARRAVELAERADRVAHQGGG